MSSTSESNPQKRGGLLPAISHSWEQYTGLGVRLMSPANYFFRELWRNLCEGHFGVLFKNQAVRDRSFAQFFKAEGHNFARYEATTDVPQLVGSAHGLVLELGPCTGNQLPYYDAAKVDHVFGVELNTAFAPVLVDRIRATGWEGKYTPIFCAIEDTAELRKHGVGPGSVDCVVSMQVLCSVHDPAAVVRELYSLLKPGGELILWEHHRSSNWVTRVAQRFWSPFWAACMGGCRLDKSIKDSLIKAGDWEAVELEVEKDGVLIMPRIWGRLIKRRE